MNLPRRALADIAKGRPLFARAVETGSQPGNLDRVARGEGDTTAVDCVTYAFWCRHRPEMAPKVRVLARTPPSPRRGTDGLQTLRWRGLDSNF